MRRIWDGLGGIAVTGLLLLLLYHLIRPYALLIVIVLILGVLGERYIKLLRRG